MERDDIFNQAVVRAQEKDFKAARSLLRNLLFKYPEDINALLLFSLVAENKKSSIQALKQILQIDPDHDIAFARLAKLKYAPPEKALAHYVPPPPRAAPAQASSQAITQEMPRLKKPQAQVAARPQIKVTHHTGGKPKETEKKNNIDPILLGVLVIIYLCVFLIVIQVIAFLVGASI